MLARVFPEHDWFEQTVRFYERLTSLALDMDLDGREAGLRVAAVGPFLILDLDPTLLDHAEQARQTLETMIFANLDDAIADALASGVEVAVAPFTAPTGRGARIRHADGLLVEYLERRPSSDDSTTQASNRPNWRASSDAGIADENLVAHDENDGQAHYTQDVVMLAVWERGTVPQSQSQSRAVPAAPPRQLGLLPLLKRMAALELVTWSCRD